MKHPITQAPVPINLLPAFAPKSKCAKQIAAAPMAITLCLMASAITANGATLVDFNFAGDDGSQATETPVVASGITATVLTRGSGMRNNGTSGVSTNGFNMRPPSGSSTTSNDTLAESFTQSVYTQFSVTVGAGQQLSLSSLDFGWATQNTANRTLSLLVAFDDATFTVANEVSTPVTLTTFYAQTDAVGRSFDLTGVSSLQDVAAGTKIEFRLYLYTNHDSFVSDALSSGNSQVGLDLIGTVSPVPEPSSFALLLGGIGFLASRRRRS